MKLDLEIFYKLPKEIQETIVNPENMDKFYATCKNFGIPQQQTDKAMDLTRDILFGKLTPNSFISTLANNGLPPETAKQLAYKISEIYFFPIKDSIKKLYDQPSQ